MRLLNKVLNIRSNTNKDINCKLREEIESKLVNYKYIFSQAPSPNYKSSEQKGKKVWILGSQPRNFISANNVLNSLDKISPSLICISDLHPTSHLDYIHYNSPSQCISPSFPYQDSDLPIKEKFFSFLDREYNKNLYFFNNDSGTFFLADPYSKTCVNDDSLSAVNWAYLERNCGLIAAGAHPFMIHEDLCHSLTLHRMREIFHLAVEECLRRGKALGQEPLKMPMQMYQMIYKIMKSMFIDEFYLKRTQYSARVVSTACKSFRRTAVIHYDPHVEMLEKLIYEGNEEYKDVFVSKYFEGNIEEVMEKIVILSHLDNKVVRSWIEYGTDPLKHMFKGQFEYPIKELQEAFDYYNQYYKDFLTRSLIQDISRIPFMSNRGRKVESFAESVKKIDSRKGEFIVGHYQKAMLDKMRCELLKKQILKNITSKFESGINQNDEILALEQISKGEYTSFSTEVLMRLIAEANSQLKLMKLPKEFRMFEDELFTRVSLENFYGYIKGVGLPSLENKKVAGLNTRQEGGDFMIVGPGEMPEAVRGKSIKEIEKMNLEKVFETPMDEVSGKPRREDPKVNRERMKSFEQFNIFE